MLCLVLRPVLRFSPRENINTDFVLTVNKPKIKFFLLVNFFNQNYTIGISRMDVFICSFNFF